MGKDDIDSLVSNVQNVMQEKFEQINDEIAASHMKYFWADNNIYSVKDPWFPAF